jgi:hypothetical protein
MSQVFSEGEEVVWIRSLLKLRVGKIFREAKGGVCCVYGLRKGVYQNGQDANVGGVKDVWGWR